MSDLFSKLFEIDMDKRITITALRDHSIFRNKATEDELSTDDTGSEAGPLV